ncbi:hypothetical protein HDV00_005383 [Rhizophlyctis rosea]|nr:hypothetical protein HDV00_005383 [Rhizophlyctis rosea]
MIQFISTPCEEGPRPKRIRVDNTRALTAKVVKKVKRELTGETTPEYHPTSGDHNVHKRRSVSSVKITEDSRSMHHVELSAFNLGPEADDLPLHRFMSADLCKVLGGNLRSAQPLAAEKKRHLCYDGGKRWFKDDMQWNPELPSQPGRHGVIYYSLHKYLANETDHFQLFVKPDGNAGYIYCGVYRCVHVDDLTFEQWSQLPNTMERWINYMNKHPTFVSGLPAKATPDEVWASLSGGELKLQYSVMEFIHYDSALIDELLGGPRTGERSRTEE